MARRRLALTADPALDATALARLERLGGRALVRQMVELFLANGPQRVSALRAAAAAGDASGVQRAAHALKSSAGNVGALPLQRSAEALERDAADGRIAARLVERLAAEYEQSERALQEALNRLEP